MSTIDIRPQMWQRLDCKRQNGEKLKIPIQLMVITFKDSTGQFIKSSELLSKKVEAILPVQELTLKAVESLNTINRFLKEMQEHQVRMIPLLKQLSGPFEFKLVPSQKENIERRASEL